MDENGVQLNVTVKTCLVDHHLAVKKYVCNREAVIAKCKRAYLSSVRQRRNAASQTPNCLNGTILPSQSSSALEGLPQVTINGHIRYLFVGDNVKFKCTVNISKLPATVSWLFNGSALVAEKNRHEYQDCNTSLLIKGALAKDAGNYTCVVQNEVGQATASAYLSYERKLKVQGPYIEYVKLEGYSGNTAYTGSTVNLTCKTQDFDVQNIFLKDNLQINEDREQKHYEYFHMPDRKKNVKIVNLEIKNVTREDAGNYTCLAVHGNGLRRLASFYLKVVNLTATCPRGYYCPLGSVHPIQCHRGTYQPQVGQSSPGACKPCPDFNINFSKPDPFVNTKPAENITDCDKGNSPTESKDKQSLPSNHITLWETLGIVAGVLVITIIVLPFYCFAKKKGWLSTNSSSSRTANQHDPESVRCEPLFPNVDCQRQSLCENMQDTEFAQVVKMVPEIDYEPKYDVFICYSYKDVDWVKELSAELEKRGFICCIDFKDFVIGATIVDNISEAICYSRKTIAVLTPDSVQSDWWCHELQKALTRIRFHQVIPIVYKSCEIPLILQDRTYLDWENCHVKPHFWDQLERALRQPNDGVI